MAINTQKVLIKKLRYQFVIKKFNTKNYNYILIILGIALPLIQFVYNRSLWLDEAYLAHNFTRNYVELLKPLDSGQVAPILFLLVVKFFSTLIPDSEYGLRLFQLICYLASFYFFCQLLWFLIKNSLARIFALTLFVFNSHLIYYSSELKQYIIDVLVITSIYYLLLRPYNNPINRFYLLAFVGTIAIGFSNVTPLILFTIGVYLVCDGIQNDRLYLNKIITLFTIWLVGFAFYYISFIHNHPSKEYMVSFWSEKNAFMPLNVFSKEFFIFFYNSFVKTLRGLLTMGDISLIPISALYIYSLVSLYRKEQTIIILLLTLPFILHLVLSSLEMYPFYFRMVLYIIPIFIVTLAYGIEIILQNRFFRISLKPFDTRIIFVFIPIIWIILFYKLYLKEYPIKREEIKESIQYVEKQSEKSDNLFIHYAAASAYNFYRDIGFVKHNMATYYSTDSMNFEDYPIEFSKLNGRVWIVFTSEYEKKGIITLLEKHGKKLNEFITYNSSAYLFDFSLN